MLLKWRRTRGLGRGCWWPEGGQGRGKTEIRHCRSSGKQHLPFILESDTLPTPTLKILFRVSCYPSGISKFKVMRETMFLPWRLLSTVTFSL
jgi:hypothetical protein